jgi:periplasmic divalent cation tolerance protein
MDNVRIVFISIPREEAEKMARRLVENRLSACVNVIPQIVSYFWWDQEVNRDQEALLVVKTTEAKLPDLMEWVKRKHPYDLPEIIALSLSGGLPDYLAWVKAETNKDH